MRLRTFVILLVVVATPVVATYRVRMIAAQKATERASYEAETRRFVETGQKAFTVLPYTPVADLRSVDAWRVAIEPATIEQSQPLPPGASIQGLLDEAAAFLHHRVGQRSPEAYVAWREAAGYRAVGADVLRGKYKVHLVYGRILGHPIDDTMEMRDLFVQAWPALERWLDDSNVARQVAATSAGLAIACGRLTPENRFWPQVRGELGEDVWYGGYARNASMTPFFEPQRTEQELLDEFGEAHCAVMAVAMQFENGDRRPLVLGFLWDPIDDRWRIFRLWTYNFPRPAAEMIF